MNVELPERFITIDIKVDGEQIIAPVVTDLTIDEIGEDMDTVAAQMGYWGNVLAAAEEELAAVDAAYRPWRGNMGMKLVEDNGKLGEWKVKQMVDASPQFLEHKAAIAKAQRSVSICDKIFQAFAKKANVLQSRGANERTVLEQTGRAIKGDPTVAAFGQSSVARQERERRKDKVRGIFSRTTK